MRRLFWVGVLSVLALWTVLSALTQVQPGERAVVRRFGRILPDNPGPGLFVGLPWGLDRVERVPVGKIRSVVIGTSGNKDDEEQRDTPMGQLLTGDHNLVNVQAEIHYTVIEDQVDRFILQADRVDPLVARLAEGALAEWIAARKVDEVLGQGKLLLPPYLILEVQKRLHKDAYDLGIKIEQAGINNLYPPEEVKEYFDRLGEAQTNIRTQVYKARQEADKQQRLTQAKVTQIERQTAAYANKQRFAAQADAETFAIRLAQYRKLTATDPNYLNTLWQDDMTSLYARMRETGRLDVLDNFLSSEGLNISQFPLVPKKK